MRGRDRMAAIAASLTVAFALLALGSAQRWAACVAVFLAGIAALPHLGSRRVVSGISPLVWLFAAAGAITALQLVPLPAGLVAWLSPERHALMLDNAAALRLAPDGFLALSFDAPATWLELAKLGGYAAFAYTTTRIAATPRGRLWLARTVVLAGATMAVIALGHHVLGMEALFGGLYTPRAQASTYLAPLLNENHLAGFLAMTVPLAIGLAVAATGPVRLFFGLSAAGAAGVSALVQSRGAAVALVVGCALLGALLALRARAEAHGAPSRAARPLDLGTLVPAGIIVTCVVILLATVTAGGVSDELRHTSMDEVDTPDSKVGVWRASAELAAANRWAGVGRGAFEFAFTRYHHSGLETYSHVENEYLQALVDWGVPGTALLALLGLWVGFLAARAWRRGPVEIGALAGLMVLGLHSFVDFGVELPGVALTAIAMAAILVPAPLEKLGRGTSRTRRLRGLALLALVAVVAALGAVAASPVARPAQDESEHLTALIEDQSADPDQVIAAGRESFRRHPSDYILAARLAQAYYYRKRDPQALVVQNRALALNPEHAGLHVFTAELLRAGQRRDQALIEFSLALRHTLTPGPILDRLLALFPDPEEAARGIPITRERVGVMVNRLLTLERLDVALAYARRASEALDQDMDIAATVADLALRSGDMEAALAASERIHRQRGETRDALLHAKVLLRAKRPEDALVVATRARQRADERGELDVGLHELLVRAHLDAGQPKEARDLAREAIDLALGDRRTQARLYEYLARAEAALGNQRDAQLARKRAKDLAAPAR